MYKMMSKSKMSWHHHAPRRAVYATHCPREASASKPGRNHGGASSGEASMPPSRRDQPCSVYLLVHEFETRFKIGLSQDPLKRAMILPDAPNLQWDACLRATLPTRDRAYQVERALHKALAVFRIHVRGFDGQAWDGGSEWFELKGLGHAVNLLSMMPEGEDPEKLIVVTTIANQPYLGLNHRTSFHDTRELRYFEAGHANVRHMLEVVKLMRRINDDLTVVRGLPKAASLTAMAARPHAEDEIEDDEDVESAGNDAVKKGQGAHHSRIPDKGHEVIYIYGLGNHWESDLLAERFRLSDSDFWMFSTGTKRGFNRRKTWMTRIEFDPQQKSTLVLTMQERGKLKALPGGARLLQLWDELWAD